jgi:hypothetical protein
VIRRLSVVLAACAILWSAFPAHAIVNGEPDGGEHPYVGEIMYFAADFADPAFDDPGAWFTCTGTLVSPTVVVTAGHCTFGVGVDGASTTAGGGSGSGGNDIWIDFSEAAHLAGFPASENYERDENDEAYADRRDFLNDSGFWIRGTAHAHDQFTEGPFILHDLGVIVLDEAVDMDVYGEIAPQGHLADTYAQEPRKDQVFELVGYGLEESRPFFFEGGHTRRKAQIKLNSLEAGPYGDAFAFFSNNSGAVHEGGTCWGDSGAPIFDNTESNLIVAVQSFSLGPRATCSGIAGGYRVDQLDDHIFLAGFGITP